MVPTGHPDGKRGRSRDWAPTEAEYRALQDAARDGVDRLCLYGLAEGGFRATEFVSILPWWLDGGSVRIPRSDPETGFRSKTARAARDVPLREMSRYAWDLLMEYLEEHGRVDFTRRTLYNRIHRMGERAGLDLYPHALRAYCATVWGHRIDTVPLMDLMGWESSRVAERYIRKSGRRTRQAIRRWRLENL